MLATKARESSLNSDENARIYMRIFHIFEHGNDSDGNKTDVSHIHTRLQCIHFMITGQNLVILRFCATRNPSSRASTLYNI